MLSELDANSTAYRLTVQERHLNYEVPQGLVR